MPRIEFLIPGDIETRTGGYEYDRRLIAGLKQAGWQVGMPRLEDEFICELPDEAPVLIDGLALAACADQLERHGRRLRSTAVIHHPAALETGLSPTMAERIAVDERRAMLAMRRIVCTSPWTAGVLESWGIEPARIHIVEPGVDMDTTALARLRRDPAVAQESGLRLLCVATLTPRKGHDLLIEALSELSDLQWHLECIGSKSRAPEYAAGLGTLLTEHGLEDRVSLRGEVSQMELAQAYGLADVFVLASRLEGYGMVLSEARAARLPVVATCGGAIRQTLAGAAALLVAPESAADLSQALRTVMTDRTAWLALAAAASQDDANPRSWTSVVNEFTAILASKPSA